MKNIVLYSFVFFFSIFASGQSSPSLQSDATWNQTTSYISKNLKHVKAFKFYQRKENYQVQESRLELRLNDSFNFILQGSNEDANRKSKILFDVHLLEKVNLLNDRLRIGLTGMYIKSGFYKLDGTVISAFGDRKFNSMQIIIPDTEMRNNLYKALNHLSNLAKKRRSEKPKKKPVKPNIKKHVVKKKVIPYPKINKPRSIISKGQYFIGFAVAYSSDDKRAYISLLHRCYFKKGERTGDVGVTYKNFDAQWRDAVVKKNKPKGFYNTKFSGWYKSLMDANKARQYQVDFHSKTLNYRVYTTRFKEPFRPDCK